MLAGLVLSEFNRGVVTALPVQGHTNLVGVQTHDDLMDDRAHDALFELRRTLRMIPQLREILAQFNQALLCGFA